MTPWTIAATPGPWLEAHDLFHEAALNGGPRWLLHRELFIMSEDAGSYLPSPQPSNPRPSGSSLSGPQLVRFDGAISSEDRDRLEHTLQRVEEVLQLNPIPEWAGAAWIVTAHTAGLVIASRLGLDNVSTAPSIDELIVQLDALSAPGGP
jgi:hypothetical protein